MFYLVLVVIADVPNYVLVLSNTSEQSNEKVRQTSIAETRRSSSWPGQPCRSFFQSGTGPFSPSCRSRLFFDEELANLVSLRHKAA